MIFYRNLNSFCRFRFLCWLPLWPLVLPIRMYMCFCMCGRWSAMVRKFISFINYQYSKFNPNGWSTILVLCQTNTKFYESRSRSNFMWKIIAQMNSYLFLAIYHKVFKIPLENLKDYLLSSYLNPLSKLLPPWTHID